MNKKDMFVKLVEHALGCMEIHPVADGDMTEEQYNEAIAYFNAFKETSDKKDKPKFTDNGKVILKAMKENVDERANMFTAKQIAEYAFISSRSVSGSIRKLVNDGYVDKAGQDPTVYSLTDLGKEVNPDEQ